VPEPVARSPIATPGPVTVTAGWQVSARRAAGALTLTDCTPLAKVAVALRRPALAAGPLAAGPLALARFGRAARDPAGTLVVGSAPGEWLLIGPVGQAQALAAGLESPAAGGDSVTCVDLTHGRALIRLHGFLAARVLAGLCGADLSDDLVPDGAALGTCVAAVATDLIRDDRSGTRSYLMHCERSAGQYLSDALLRAGAAFGIEVDGFRPPGI